MVRELARTAIGAGALLTLMASTGCQDLLGLTTGKASGSGTSGSGGTGNGGSGGTSNSTGGTTSSHAGGSTSHGGSGGSTSQGGSGGMASNGSSSNGGSGGSGGSGECGPDCTSDDCTAATCNAGRCELTPKPAGTLVQNATPGDCKADLCDGAGSVALDAPWDPDFADGNDCTWDACAGGLAGHMARRNGSACNGGVCEAGACVAASCAAMKNGVVDGKETGIDCGGVCPPCNDGQGCRVAADCASGFCAGTVCAEPLMLAATEAAGLLRFATFKPADATPWTVSGSATVYGSIGSVGVSFDAAGEGVAAFRQGSTGARSARWAGGAWGNVALWGLSGEAGAGAAWIPTFAATAEGLYLFAENSNFQHEVASAGGASGGPFTPVGNASSPLSGGAATRQGHASFFTPDGIVQLVERRFIAGQWSAPLPVMPGDFSDGQPATAVLPGLGTLVVAVRRTGNDHVLAWAILGDNGVVATGNDLGPQFMAPAPPPRRLGLASRAGGGAILALRTTAGFLDVWVGDGDGNGGLVWSQKNVGLGTPAIRPDPAVARGLAGAQAELAWVTGSGEATMRHARLLADGTWSDSASVVPGADGSVAIATP